MFVYDMCVCHDTHVEVRRQLCGVHSLLQFLHGLNSGCQAYEVSAKCFYSWAILPNPILFFFYCVYFLNFNWVLKETYFGLLMLWVYFCLAFLANFLHIILCVHSISHSTMTTSSQLPQHREINFCISSPSLVCKYVS